MIYTLILSKKNKRYKKCTVWLTRYRFLVCHTWYLFSSWGLGARRFDQTPHACLLVSLDSHKRSLPLTLPPRTLRPVGKDQCSLYLHLSAQSRSTIRHEGNCQEAGPFWAIWERLGVIMGLDDGWVCSGQGQTRPVDLTWLTVLGGAMAVGLIQVHARSTHLDWCIFRAFPSSFLFHAMSPFVPWCMNVTTCYLFTPDRKLESLSFFLTPLPWSHATTHHFQLGLLS